MMQTKGQAKNDDTGECDNVGAECKMDINTFKDYAGA